MTDLTSPLQRIRDLYEPCADVGAPGVPLTQLGEALSVSTGPEGEQLTPTGEEILAERLRQLTFLGYDAANDMDREEDLANAAYCYLLVAATQYHTPIDRRAAYHTAISTLPPMLWPWDAGHWHPSPDPIRNLVKAGALAAAAGDADRLWREDDLETNRG